MRAALSLCMLALAGCAQPDSALEAERQWRACKDQDNPAARVIACTRRLEDPAAASADRVTALLQRGDARLSQGNYVRAIADYGRALRLDPVNTHALFQRGLAHFERGAFAVARADFAAVLAIDPANARALHWRANAEQDLAEQFERQLLSLSSQIAERPQDASLLNERCWLRATGGRELDKALSDCNQALGISPRDARILDSRGLVFLKLGDFPAALADYEAALEIAPQNGHFLYGRAIALHALDRAEEAASAFEAAEARQPGIAALYRSYGIARS